VVLNVMERSFYSTQWSWSQRSEFLQAVGKVLRRYFDSNFRDDNTDDLLPYFDVATATGGSSWLAEAGATLLSGRISLRNCAMITMAPKREEDICRKIFLMAGDSFET
jgi:hypothetical protein